MCKSILVLDDDLAILGALQTVLEYSGYTVNTLPCGNEIFESIEKYQPDLILLDVMLADMDGREICNDIKQKEQEGSLEKIPVILISATHNLADCIKSKGAPDDFLAKPFDITVLLNKIETHLTAA